MTTAAPRDEDAGADRPVVAAFDFDGTLTKGGSVWSFLTRVAGPVAVARAAVVLLPRLARAALFGGRAADDAKEALFVRILGGRDAGDVGRLGATFGLEHLRRRGRADVRARLEWHRARGHRIAIVSASPECYVGAVGDALTVDAVVATRLEVGPDGNLTGRYEGRNCRGAEKVARLEQWMATSPASDTARDGTPAGRAGDSTPFLWAYGNSAGDRRLLAAADVGVDVGRLGRVGRLRAFPRLADLRTTESPG